MSLMALTSLVPFRTKVSIYLFLDIANKVTNFLYFDEKSILSAIKRMVWVLVEFDMALFS